MTHTANRVFFRSAAYRYSLLRQTVFELLEAVGCDRFSPGDRVLIKPNFLTPALPGQAVLTHPLVLRAVVEYVLDKGGRARVSDSPALASFERVLRVGGYKDALQGLEVVCKPFERTVGIDIGTPFGTLEIARAALESNGVINLAKLKTHTHMRLTLGVKNLFGTVVGMAKSQWHLRCGLDRDTFARLLVRVYEVVGPTATLVDAILAMEGQGPGKSGRPRSIGVLVAGRSAHSVDFAICRMLAFEPRQLPTLKAAMDLGVHDGSFDVDGKYPLVAGFDIPDLGPFRLGHERFDRFNRKYLMQKPMAMVQHCCECGQCREICPAGAIPANVKTTAIDYDRCIRCYCCVEICPHGAMEAVAPWPGRLFRRLKLLR